MQTWLPYRPSATVPDNWPPKPLAIYADIDYERSPVMSETGPIQAPDDTPAEPADDPIPEPTEDPEQEPKP